MTERVPMRREEVVKLTGDDRPVLIAGPTASGKSALALTIAERHGGVVVNADALQVHDRWRILTARPDDADLARAPHALYGHVSVDQSYSAGHWLRDVAEIRARGKRPIFVGGTGLYLSALTGGLADIPPIPHEIRIEAEQLLTRSGIARLLADLDRKTLERIDRANPARVQRAWEVLRATGRGLASWQDETPAPQIAPDDAMKVVLEMPPAVLEPRIVKRFDGMLESGALEEARANLATYDPSRPADRAIGAPELVAHLEGEIPLEAAREQAIIATRKYAKRQRTWFRKRMRDWVQIPPPEE
ncbi:tRNA (adenosine(37)-N6)-dimethylallyltransferase MiaA [Palleronia sp. LCG004]|uniref:tRNA (adenosine(37)-N6)-dimethylallyltransferase MiaA n=1 Tax=Palleronia sp. LCG004 TaxID=3079304 RepID=UPI002942B26C|nr:tRNA (adenosine(37)-N6)-dimethylallyltransferase MiaA [Palleronia sp. LCG004]WOI57009.1 tRNA (adenosine(37)-N6)-dimethylallyltransferase MiaA [Palleronia sp. LCG004]